MRPLTYLTALTLLCLPCVLVAESLWQNAEYGMTVDQVKSLFPTASESSALKKEVAGAVELLRIDDYTILKKQFSVSFIFRGGKLTEVFIDAKEKQPFSRSLVTFDSLAEALRSKYGDELSRKRENGPFLFMAESKWVSGKTSIVLTTMSAGGPGPLSIRYSTDLSKEAEKL